MSFIKNTKNTCYFASSYHLAGPFAFSEAEVLTFTQKGGESSKDAWYRINDSQKRDLTFVRQKYLPLLKEVVKVRKMLGIELMILKKEPPRINPLLSCLEIFMLGFLLGVGLF